MFTIYYRNKFTKYLKFLFAYIILKCDDPLV